MDTPEGYKEILSFLDNGCRREHIEALAAGRRIFLIRHGQTKQHDEKMFIGQYDVPLSDTGRLMMKETAGKLADYGIAADQDVYKRQASRLHASCEDSLARMFR